MVGSSRSQKHTASRFHNPASRLHTPCIAGLTGRRIFSDQTSGDGFDIAAHGGNIRRIEHHISAFGIVLNLVSLTGAA